MALAARLCRCYKTGRTRDSKRVDAGLQTRLWAKKGYKSDTLSYDHVRALKVQPDTPQGRRDRLLMCLLLDHGLRCGEVAMHPKALQAAGGWNSPTMVMRYVDEAEVANEGVIL